MTTPNQKKRSDPHPVLVVFGLGGNLHHPLPALRQAVTALRSWTEDLQTSSVYLSSPVSPIPQPDYYNLVALGRTRRLPEELLALAKALEMAAGRRRGPRFAPRPLDVDLLLFGSLSSPAPELTLPHPRLAERRFVLVPLAEIAPDLAIPPEGRTVSELLAGTGAAERLERLGPLEEG